MNNRRRMTGVVASDKMMKTVVVVVSRTYKHPLYKKVVHASSRFKAHDELDAKVGDVVTIVESRPLSRDKRWVVEKIDRRLGEAALAEPIVESVMTEENDVAEAVAPVAVAAETAVAETAVAEDVATEAAAVETSVEEASEVESETAQVEETDADNETSATDTVEGE